MCRVGGRSPWGTIDHVREIAPGIWHVGTPGHGGIKLDAANNRKVHPAWRKDGGWYEEDCEWSIPALTFPEHFTESHRKDAEATAKNYFPTSYEAAFGVKVTAAESRKVREREFKAAHLNDYIVFSACGDWHEDVPTGMVGVHARRVCDKNERTFLVPANEYDNRAEFGFVIDPARHQEWHRGPRQS